MPACVVGSSHAKLGRSAELRPLECFCCIGGLEEAPYLLIPNYGRPCCSKSGKEGQGPG